MVENIAWIVYTVVLVTIFGMAWMLNRKMKVVNRHAAEITSFYQRWKKAIAVRNALVDELNALAHDSKATPSDFEKLLPRCLESDRAWMEFLILDKLLEDWVRERITNLEVVSMVGDYSLMRSKLRELFDDPSATRANWIELLPICQSIDDRARELAKKTTLFQIVDW